jgi:hypothetical protein
MEQPKKPWTKGKFALWKGLLEKYPQETKEITTQLGRGGQHAAEAPPIDDCSEAVEIQVALKEECKPEGDEDISSNRNLG